jgi:enoyl-CoA hydratase/carnithine racemase
MRGAGDKAFVSGADISQFESQRTDAEAAARYDAISEDARHAMASLEKPLIAMIRGFCLGGGVGIAMAADMRFASDDSSFGIPAARLGISYGFSSLKKLVELVGPAYAKEILLTARRFSAEEALHIGLVNRVVPVAELEATVLEVCAMIVDNSPLSIVANKATIDEVSKDAVARDVLRIEELGRICFDSADYAEGRRAFMEKRKPVWSGK